MNWVAIRMLLGDKLKYIALVAGVAFASLLVTQQASIFTGYALRTGAWLRDTNAADLWVMDEQVDHSDDFKPMLETTLTRVRGIDGVQWAVPMYKGFIEGQLPDGTRRNMRVIGLDDATLVGGPPEMVQGQLADLRQDRAVFINADKPVTLDHTSNKRPLKVGDTLSLNDHELVVAGTYRSSSEFFWEPVIFTTYSRAAFLRTDTRKTLTYVLVKVRPGQDIAAVAARIKHQTGLSALTSNQFESQTMWWILNKTGILVNFGITIALGFVIGVLVAGQTFFTFVLDNVRHFAALMAMGTSRLTVLRMLVVQVLVITAIGYGLGVGGASVTGAMFSKIGLAFQMAWQIPVFGGLAVLVCCLLAGALGMVRVLRTEPAIVFKG